MSRKPAQKKKPAQRKTAKKPSPAAQKASEIIERMQRGRPTKYDPMYCDMVEDEMKRGLSLTAFAGLIGVARSTINEWMAQNPEFSEAVGRAKAKRLLFWERQGLSVAESGGPGGQATMIIFGLKNMGGDEWKDKHDVEHTGPEGGAIPLSVTMSEERFREIAREIEDEI